MKLSTKLYVLYLSLMGVYGIVLSMCGFDISNWQMWVLLILTVLISNVNYFRGYFRGKVDKGLTRE